MLPLALALVWFADLTAVAPPAGAPSVAGVVRLRGAAPAAAPIRPDPILQCPSAIDASAISAGADGGLAGVVVRVLDGARVLVAPAAPVEIREQGCALHPRVTVAVLGQAIVFRNLDRVVHSAHLQRGEDHLYNYAMMPNAERGLIRTLPSGPLALHCDVHPWERGWLWVVRDARFAISDEHGAFALRGLAPGRYTAEAWHEQLGTRRFAFEVKPGRTATAEIVFDAAR